MFFKDEPQTGPTWGVVTTCLEPTALVVAFVAHHLAQGASRVHVFLDVPQPETQRLLAQIPQCHVTVCDAEYWQDEIQGPRPPTTEKRQIRNATRAFRKADVDWLLHLDVDEFLRTDLPMDQIVSALPEHVDFLHLPNLERVFDASVPQQTLFGGLMRKPLLKGWPDQTDILSDAVHPFLHRGIAAHSQGKSMVRTGRDMLQGIHSPRALGNQPRLCGFPALNAQVLHFDGLTGFHWVMKLLRGWSDRGRGRAVHSGLVSGRQAQIQYVDEHQGDLNALMALHQRVKALCPADLQRLNAMGLLCESGIDPVAAVQRLGLGLEAEVDLSVWGFDRAVRLNIPDLDRKCRQWHRIYRRHFRETPEKPRA